MERIQLFSGANSILYGKYYESSLAFRPNIEYQQMILPKGNLMYMIEKVSREQLWKTQEALQTSPRVRICQILRMRECGKQAEPPAVRYGGLI